MGRPLGMLLMAALAACGGRGDPVLSDRDAGRDAAAARDAGADAGPPAEDAGLDASAPEDAGTVADAGAAADAATDGGADPDGSAGSLAPTLVSVDLWANCMPIVAPDPFHITFTVRYDNPGASPASATVAGAKVTFDDGAGSAIDLVVDPSTVGPVAPGGSETIDHDKTSSSPTLSSACDTCGGDAQLEVEIDTGATIETLRSGPFTVSCVY